MSTNNETLYKRAQESPRNAQQDREGVSLGFNFLSSISHTPGADGKVQRKFEEGGRVRHTLRLLVIHSEKMVENNVYYCICLASSLCSHLNAVEYLQLFCVPRPFPVQSFFLLFQNPLHPLHTRFAIALPAHFSSCPLCTCRVKVPLVAICTYSRRQSFVLVLCFSFSFSSYLFFFLFFFSHTRHPQEKHRARTGQEGAKVSIRWGERKRNK